MRQILAIGVAAVLSVALATCSRDKATSKEGTEAASPTAEHAATDVVPGSHEDWCGEHAVPESQCTRCNPDLVAAFKATGDWCDEHGVPESHCLKCNPDLEIVRPPKAADAKGE